MLLNNTYDIGENLQVSIKKFFNKQAIYVEDVIYTYEELYNKSLDIKNMILSHIEDDEKFIGIMSYRSINAYSGIVGTLFSKKAYLPINPSNPVEKLKKIFQVSECKTIVLSEECADLFSNLIDSDKPLKVICPEPGEKIINLMKKESKHVFIFPEDVNVNIEKKVTVSNKEPAYMMFTSGSTGDPKGIVVSHGNLFSYCEYTLSKYNFSSSDRFSQMFDITFDLSVHDIMITFLSGASLYVVPKKMIMSPGEFIKKHELTVWFSVPSVAMFMDRMKVLQPNSLPSLRYSLFCGEGLPSNTVEQWKIAAPKTIIDNLYGPTEATIAFMEYRWEKSNLISINGLVPIGTPFEGIEVKLIKTEVEIEEIGELCVSGQQVVNGYFKNEELTKEKFIHFDDNPNKIWYKTGDLVKKIDDENYAFLGRTDDQIQIRGYRVEMLEVDKAIRDAVGHQMAISVPIFSEDNNNMAEDIVAFVEENDNNISENHVISYCKSVLPEYMVPSNIYFVDSMPLNTNGKIDKKALVKSLDNYILDNVDEIMQSDDKSSVKCSVCLKSLEEDERMNGVGLIKIINHQGNDDFICHICLKGF